LARSTAELLSIEADLSKRGIGLVVLSMGGERLDTRNPTSKLMLPILAGVATWEREMSGPIIRHSPTFVAVLLDIGQPARHARRRTSDRSEYR
jgi:hypothetical protein